MINFRNILELQSNLPSDLIFLGNSKNTKMMFHKLKNHQLDIHPHFNKSNFENFQKEHRNTFFANSNYVFSFYYTGGSAEFLVTYKLGLPIIDKVFDNEENKERDRYRFPEMKKIDILTEYENRLYITWTNPSANYGRWLDTPGYEVQSILPSRDNSIGPLPRNYYENWFQLVTATFFT